MDAQSTSTLDRAAVAFYRDPRSPPTTTRSVAGDGYFDLTNLEGSTHFARPIRSQNKFRPLPAHYSPFGAAVRGAFPDSRVRRRPSVDRTPVNESLGRGSPLSETLASLTPNLADVLAATPKPERKRAIKAFARAIRSQVNVLDEAAGDHIRSRPIPTSSAVASTRRPSRKARVGVEDLEGRAAPSVMTITVTNHPTTQVQHINPTTPI